MLDNKEKKERILRLGMIDTCRNSQIALPVVMLLEVYMIISWLVNVEDKTSMANLCYLIGYILLFVFCGVIVTFIHQARKNLDANYHKVDFMQHVTAFVLLSWSVAFTFVGSELRGNFDYLIFITFVTMLPLFCYMRPVFWTILQLAGASVLFYLASHHDRFFAFVINFSVFTIISMVAGWAVYYFRHFGYERQIDLEEERNHAHKLAYKDPLTDLPNRQSFSEDFEKLRTDPNFENLIILVCDVNGLKVVNDQLGHKAGEELIQGAAFCLQKSFESMGTIYRVGGDEFAGILHGTEQQMQDAIRQYEWITANWKGQLASQLSISIGHASVRSNPTATLSMLLTQADDAMYEAKRLHYNK